MVTQLWECLSSETSEGLTEVEDIGVLIEEIRKSVISNLNKLSQRAELSNMG